MNKHREKEFGIVFEDRDLILVNKKGGILSVPVRGSGGRSVYSLLSERHTKRGAWIQVVHRIDRYTSGLLLFAKNPASRRNLITQFLKHTPIRKYRALVVGQIKESEGELKDYVRLNGRTFLQEIVSKESRGGDLAHLRFKVVQRFPHATDIEVSLVTGLKNQIRAQFSHHGFPLIGERQYLLKQSNSVGAAWIDRQALHASELTFNHPRTGREGSFTADLPKDFLRARDALLHWNGAFQAAKYPHSPIHDDE